MDTTRKVCEIMTRDVTCVTPDTPCSELARLLVMRMISGAPVVDSGGRLVGVVTLADLVARSVAADRPVLAGAPPTRHHRAPHYCLDVPVDETLAPVVEPRAGGGVVGSLMTTTVVTATEADTVHHVAERMLASRVHLVVVVRDHEVVGLVSSLDLVRLLAESGAESATLRL